MRATSHPAAAVIQPPIEIKTTLKAVLSMEKKLLPQKASTRDELDHDISFFVGHETLVTADIDQVKILLGQINAPHCFPKLFLPAVDMRKVVVSSSYEELVIVSFGNNPESLQSCRLRSFRIPMVQKCDGFLQ